MLVMTVSCIHPEMFALGKAQFCYIGKPIVQVDCYNCFILII